MKKITILFIVMLLMGCSAISSIENEHSGKYENYIELIINNNGAVSAEIPFEYEVTIEENNGEYIYDVDIFNPRVAMYDVEMIAVDQTLITDDYLAPSLGVAEDTQFNMIPNQSDSSRGYYQRLGLNGIAPGSDFTLQMLVSYKDATLVNEKLIFFTIHSLDYLEIAEDEAVSEESVTDETGTEDGSTEETEEGAQ